MGSICKRNVVAVIGIALVPWPNSLLAEPVAPEQARKVSETFIERHLPHSRERLRELSLCEGQGVQSPAVVRLQEIRDDAGALVAHIAELRPGGFVAMSADTGIAPIIAYSFHNPFPSDDENPLCQMLREDMRARRQALAMNLGAATADHNQGWNAYVEEKGDVPESLRFQQWPPGGTTATGGWLETMWDQKPPYNALCPLDPVDANRTYVGCVATAFAQIINYHGECGFRFGPADSYTSDYGITVDADCTMYDFPSFTELNAYLETVRAKYAAGDELDDMDIAALSLACGVSVEMDYSSEGSGAWTTDVADAMRQELDFYSADITDGLSRQLYRVLQENLINGLPALLTIREPNAYRGHAIVCDGYNTRGEYHLNFGWGGERPDEMTEAWYRLPVDMPSFLSVLTGSILNIQPDEPVIEVEPTSFLFASLPGQASEPRTLRIRSDRAGTKIRVIRSPEGFLIADVNDNVFSDVIESLEIPLPQLEVAIHVKFYPDLPGDYQGTLEIESDDGHVRHVFLRGNAFAGGTEVPGGTVSGRWSQADSPYFVSGDVTVPRNGSLMIDPGVKVMFLGPYSMTVGRRARLLAMGTVSSPVEFTAWNKDGGWAGLRFVDSADDDILRHCVITFAQKSGGITEKRPSDETQGFEGGDPNSFGGAVYCSFSDPTILNCEIANNGGDVAGAIYCYESSPKVTNTVIANNSCTGSTPQCGGLFAEMGSVPEIANCTIVNNAPGGLFSASWEGMKVTNTIVWGNDDYQIEVLQSAPEVRFCDVQGGFPGEGNIDADPCFFHPSSDVGMDFDGTAAIWSLRNSSPCINSGTPLGLPQTDVGGNLRMSSEVVDIGAYESQSELPLITILPSVTLDAGFVPIGEESVARLEIRNTGTRDVSIESVDIGEGQDALYVVTPIPSHILQPGHSVQVEVGFTPSEEKTYEGTLSVLSSAANGTHKSVALRGVGVAGTVVPGGAVSGIWTRDQSPLTVTGDIFIPVGHGLAIKPGVVVQFAGRFSFTVGFLARLEARGTQEEPIIFTATDAEQGWFGIRFINTEDDDMLRYCTVEYAKKPRSEGGGYLNLMGGGILCCSASEMAPGSHIPSSPWIDHCVIANNHGNIGGGIMITDGSDAAITHCSITDNSTDTYGGGLLIYAARGTVANCVVAHNSGQASGGIACWESHPLIMNNTIVHNRPNGLYLESTATPFWGAVPILNNIIWENELYVTESVWPSEYAIRFNDIQGGWTGQGNFDVDPVFADPEGRDYHLKSEAGRWDPDSKSWVADTVTSPCIDAGDPDAPVSQEPAPHGNRLNMGAYGGTAEASKSP